MLTWPATIFNRPLQIPSSGLYETCALYVSLLGLIQMLGQRKCGKVSLNFVPGALHIRKSARM